MNFLRFSIQSFRYYLKSHLSLVAGVAISAMVILGALLVGDSVKYSLLRIAEYRLGQTTYALSAGDRFMTDELAKKTEGIPVLQLQGTASSNGGKARLENVNINGVEPAFFQLGINSITTQLSGNEVAISKNVAQRLNLDIHDNMLIRMEKASLVPKNAPFVSEEGDKITIRTKVVRILEKEEMGAFNLQNSQTAPFNIFMNLADLQDQGDLKGRINLVLYNDAASPMQTISKSWEAEDAGLVLNPNETDGTTLVSSHRVFIDPQITKALSGSTTFLTYFINEISKEDKITPYSFVAGSNDKGLKKNEMDVSAWLANDLNLSAGDTVWLKYFLVGPLRELKVDSSWFVVRSVQPMKGDFVNAALTPDIPGMSEAGNCRDWDTGVPVDLGLIRDKDEDYWDAYRGAPKAFIALETAQELWANRFGNATAFRVADVEALEKDLKSALSPEDIGLNLIPVKENAVWAAKNGVDFGQLFIGLSFFILVAGIVLQILLLVNHLEHRKGQIGTLMSFGIRQSKIRNLLFAELFISTLVGLVPGILLAILYNKVVFIALNRVWNDIVRTEMLTTTLDPLILVQGVIISLLVLSLTAYWVLKRTMKKSIHEQQQSITAREKSIISRISGGVSVFLPVSAVLLFIALVLSQSNDTAYYFLSGLIFLVGCLFLGAHFLKRLSNVSLSFKKYWHLSLKNISRNQSRSLSILITFSLGVFLVVSTGLNRKDMGRNASEAQSGTGGFDYFVENTIPVLHNLNDETVRSKEGLIGVFDAVQFRKASGDDASCLNLNRITNPAILGVNPALLSGRFSFASHLSGDDDIWQRLLDSDDGNVIPAIADQTVIQWGLGLKVGDTLTYKTESGELLKLKLIGGLANSIFQGYVIIADKYFIKYFPSSSGSNVMLLKSDQPEDLADEITNIYRDYGIQIVDTESKLASFYSVENTYLAIFLVLGVLGLVIGMAGLGIVLARSVYERSSEIALLRSVGIKSKKLLCGIFFEYWVLLIASVIIGVASAFMSTYPSIASFSTDVGFSTVLNVLVLLLFTGSIIVLVAALIQLSKSRIIGQLRSE